MWSRILLFGAALVGGYLIAVTPDWFSTRKPMPDPAGAPEALPQVGDLQGHDHERAPRARRKLDMSAEGRLADPNGHKHSHGLTEEERAEREALRLARREPLSKDEVRDLLEDNLVGALPDREMSPAEMEKLAGVVMRVRASQRVLRRLEATGAGETVREKHRQKLMEALAELFAITGTSGDLGSGSDGGKP